MIPKINFINCVTFLILLIALSVRSIFKQYIDKMSDLKYLNNPGAGYSVKSLYLE
jgi:hypothetical protein